MFSRVILTPRGVSSGRPLGNPSTGLPATCRPKTATRPLSTKVRAGACCCCCFCCANLSSRREYRRYCCAAAPATRECPVGRINCKYVVFTPIRVVSTVLQSALPLPRFITNLVSKDDFLVLNFAFCTFSGS